MEKKKRRISLPVKIILIVLVAVILIIGGIAAPQLLEFAKMSPIPTGEVIPGIYAVNNSMVNFYLLKGDGGYLMIDAGMDQAKTAYELERLGISTGEIRAVLLTHSDYDHTGALPLFPGAQVYLSEQESASGRNSISFEYGTFNDDETLNILGFSVRCILTPGHTYGSVCYLINDKYLFTGDTLSLKNGKVDLFNSFFNTDDEIQRLSIYKLAEVVAPEYIFTAHYGYSNDPATAFVDWIQ